MNDVAEVSISAAKACEILSSRTALPKGTDRAVAAEAAAQLMNRAGATLAAQGVNSSKILPVLQTIETLAGIPGEAVAPWLALRALNLPRGAQIGISDDDLKNPIVAALIDASGFVPTTDPESTVRGIYGSDAGLEFTALASNGRIAAAAPNGDIYIASGSGSILSARLADGAEKALAAIEAVSVSASANVGKVIAPILYNLVTDAPSQDFSQSVFTGYRLRRIEIPGASAHPTALVESSALASVSPPAPSYAPHFHADIVDKGVLSDVQIEAIIYSGEAHSKYLVSNPDDANAPAPRQGILIGHGTGVGKGRIIAGVIRDNWAQGRRRHIWVSENGRLIEDARRDWAALGGRPEEVLDIREFKAGDPMPPLSGVLFVSYASLRTEGEEIDRLRQMVDWFGTMEDGVVAFDEAQNLRNAKAVNAKGFAASKISAQGLAANALQNSLPHSRVLYVSATSASDIASMGFALRLGLWGRGTSFATATRFFDAMEEGGVNALEMVARDLKAMGLYLAANLSFEGVSYERMERPLTAQERDTQDRLADMWAKVHRRMKKAMRTTGRASFSRKVSGKHNLGVILFSASRSRFFQATLASMKTPMLIDAIRADLKNGFSPIIQMTNTFAANTERAINEVMENGSGDVNDVDASPKDILIEFLRVDFPTVKFHVVKIGKKQISQPVLDPITKEPVECPVAVAERDALIAEVQAMAVPEGPLEQLMDAFGPDLVAEVTGRSRRLVPAATPGNRVIQERTAADTADDVRAFNEDQKPILVFSSAGATGATYSASKTFRNQRLRRHYLLQPGWRADLALQGMGRSHRSNQAQPPEYVLLTTDLWSDRRMISAVSTGMRSLGALTRGLRQAASQDFFTADDCFEDEFSEAAWPLFVEKLHANSIPGLSIGQFEAEACIILRGASGAVMRSLPPVRRFLNAMGAMKCQSQDLFGQHYRAMVEGLKLDAIQDGSYDRGIETITPDSLLKLEDTVIHRDPRTGGETRLLKMLRVDELDPITYVDARKMALAKGNTQIVKSAMTGRIAILAFPRMVAGRGVLGSDPVEIITPTGARTRTREEVVREGWARVDIIMAENLWNAELGQRGLEEERTFWVVSGVMLPIWNKLPCKNPTVYRMETDEGEQLLGLTVTEKFVDTLLTRVDALKTGGLPKGDVEKALANDGIVTLVNGWVLEGRTNLLTGNIRITLTMSEQDGLDFSNRVVMTGMISTLAFKNTDARFVLPKDERARSKAISEILATAPAAASAKF
jgi:hypothetical protein